MLSSLVVCCLPPRFLPGLLVLYLLLGFSVSSLSPLHPLLWHWRTQLIHLPSVATSDEYCFITLFRNSSYSYCIVVMLIFSLTSFSVITLLRAVFDLRACEIPRSVSKTVNNFFHYACINDPKKATPTAELMSVLCVAIFWVVNASSGEKSCLHFSIPTESGVEGEVSHRLNNNNVVFSFLLCHLHIIFRSALSRCRTARIPQ